MRNNVGVGATSRICHRLDAELIHCSLVQVVDQLGELSVIWVRPVFLPCVEERLWCVFQHVVKHRLPAVVLGRLPGAQHCLGARRRDLQVAGGRRLHGHGTVQHVGVWTRADHVHSTHVRAVGPPWHQTSCHKVGLEGLVVAVVRAGKLASKPVVHPQLVALQNAVIGGTNLRGAEKGHPVEQKLRRRHVGGIQSCHLTREGCRVGLQVG
mmetsp:Transcript_118254/g.280749  ORF Transcript_118254/g.280749 Transcript_118254/m.280749 type:complete len:210 (-) Transcript_118254:1887-2516(-)